MPYFEKLDASVVYECGISHRMNARSISWNSSGTALVMAGSDRTAKVYTMVDLMSSGSSSSSSSIREFSTIQGSFDRIRFHPTQDNLLATISGSDATVRLWDLRASKPRSVGKIDLTGCGRSGGSNGSNLDISWSPSTKAGLLAVAEKNGNAHVVDTRKLSGGNSTFQTPSATSGSKANNKSNNNAPFLKSFALQPKMVDVCVFSPSGDHLVAATSADGYGELTVWNWEATEDKNSTSADDETPATDPAQTIHPVSSLPNKHVYPAHTGLIYSCGFSPNGRRLATGGGDALVGLWDVDTMVCAATVPRCDRFVRSVSFSFDSHVVATSTEEASIDLADAETGALVGRVSMASSEGGGNRGGKFSSRNPPGADELAFHPKAHVLACARCDSTSCSPLAVMKLTLGRQ